MTTPPKTPRLPGGHHSGFVLMNVVWCCLVAVRYRGLKLISEGDIDKIAYRVGSQWGKIEGMLD